MTGLKLKDGLFLCLYLWSRHRWICGSSNYDSHLLLTISFLRWVGFCFFFVKVCSTGATAPFYNQSNCKLQARSVVAINSRSAFVLMLSLAVRSQLTVDAFFETRKHFLPACVRRSYNHRLNEAFADSLIKSAAPEVSQVLRCHSGRRRKQEKTSPQNTSSRVGGQVKTRSLSLICQQNKQ